MSIPVAATLTVLIIMFLYYFLFKWQKKTRAVGRISASYRQLLEVYVPFYQQLNDGRKSEFEERVQEFLAGVRITGVKTRVEDIDRVLIAASAIIPIFNFPGWQYINLHEVLLYPGAFDEDYRLEGSQRSYLGIVGNGPLNHVMILSQSALRHAFINKTGRENAALHEFVHLVDKMDGSVDGLPAFILDKQYILPWLQLMRREIALIQENHSDINPYGATNEAEFFAVVSEYFFKRPQLFKERHPELFELLEKIFRVKA
jgi:Mlc titration factor MtfA (ptsG expression regulator)